MPFDPQKKSEQKTCLRAVAAWTLTFFVSTNLITPAVFPEVSMPVSPKMKITADILSEIRLAAGVGEVGELHAGALPQTVIIIRDAHAVPRAQKNISRLILDLTRRYDIPLVAVEGASSDLEAALLDAFPNRKILERVMNEYAARGELTGPSLARILAPGETRYEGVEDWSLYVEGLRLYHRASRNTKRLLASIETKKRSHERLKLRLYSETLIRIDRRLQDFDEGRISLADLLLDLAAVEAPDPSSSVGRVYRECLRDKEGEPVVEHEIRREAARIEKYLIASSPGSFSQGRSREVLASFHRQYQAYRTSVLHPGEFGNYLQALAKRINFPVDFSRETRKSIQRQQKIRRVAGGVFFREFGTYQQSVKDRLLRSEAEKKLDRKTRKLRLAEKLAKLELTFSDWQEVRDFLASGKDPVFGPGFEDPEAFYQNASRRDKILLRNLLRRMKKNRAKAAIFVAGGFHTQGVTAGLRELGLSYIVASPQMDSLEGKESYKKTLSGEVTWKSYFKNENGNIRLYDAFMRSVRDRLLDRDSLENRKSLDRSNHIRILWRENLLRDLASRGRLQDAGSLTSLLDEIKPKEASDPFLGAWLTNVRRLFEAVRVLDSRGQLNERNLLRRLQVSGILQAAGGNAGLSRMSEIPADCLPYVFPGPASGFQAFAGGDVRFERLGDFSHTRARHELRFPERAPTEFFYGEERYLKDRWGGQSIIYRSEAGTQRIKFFTVEDVGKKELDLLIEINDGLLDDGIPVLPLRAVYVRELGWGVQSDFLEAAEEWPEFMDVYEEAETIQEAVEDWTEQFTFERTGKRISLADIHNHGGFAPHAGLLDNIIVPEGLQGPVMIDPIDMQALRDFLREWESLAAQGETARQEMRAAETIFPELTPEEAERFKRTHIVIADDDQELLKHYQFFLKESGFFDATRLHLLSDVDPAAEEVRKLRLAGVPDDEILVITDLAFGLVNGREKRRDGVDLINRLRLIPEKDGLGFKGRILVVSGSVSSESALPDLFNQDSRPLRLGYEQKAGNGDFGTRFFGSVIKILKDTVLVTDEITEPLTKSAKFKSPSIRREDWAVFNSLEEDLRASLSTARRAFAGMSSRPPSAAGDPLSRTGEILSGLEETLNQPYWDRARKFHDFNGRAARMSGDIYQMKTLLEKNQGILPSGEAHQFQEALKAMEKTLKKSTVFAEWVQAFTRFLEDGAKPVTFGEILKDHIPEGRFGGKFHYNKKFRVPDRAVTDDVLEWEMPLAAAFIFRVILANSLDAYESLQGSEAGADAWEKRPVLIETFESADEWHRVRKVKVTDYAGGLKNFKNTEDIFKPWTSTREDHPGFGLFWAKYLADELKIRIVPETDPEEGTTSFTLEFTEEFSDELPLDERMAELAYEPKNEAEDRRQREIWETGGKIAGIRGLAQAEEDLPIRVPLRDDFLDFEVWRPFIEANKDLREKGNLIVLHFEHLLDYISAQAYGTDDTELFFQRLNRLKKQFRFDSPKELFSEGFLVSDLKDESGKVERHLVRAQLAGYLDRLSLSFQIPNAGSEGLEDLLWNRIDDFWKKVEAMEEASPVEYGKSPALLRGSDVSEDNFLENRSGELLTLPFLRGHKEIETFLQMLQFKVRDAWITRKKTLDEESFSMTLMKYEFFDAGFFAFTDLGGRLVVEMNVGQPDTLAKGGASATIAEFEMTPDGKVRHFKIRQPFSRMPSVIHFGRRMWKKSENPSALARIWEDNTVQIRDSDARYHRVPLNQTQLFHLAETLWRLQRHKAFGYRLEVEGGMKLAEETETREIWLVQARPVVGIPETDYEPLPDTWEDGEWMNPFSDAATFGRGKLERAKVVLISDLADPRDIAWIDAHYPTGYIRVEDDIASKDYGNARVLADPRRGERFAHNITRLSSKIGSGELIYTAGHDLQYIFRELEYEEAAPGIRVSKADVTVIANWLDSRIFRHAGESKPAGAAVPSDDDNPLIPRDNLEEVWDAASAAKASPYPMSVVYLSDDRELLEDLRQLFSMLGIDGVLTSSIEAALAELAKRGKSAIFISDERLEDSEEAKAARSEETPRQTDLLYGHQVINEALKRGFKGLIIWTTGGLMDTQKITNHKELQEAKTLWTMLNVDINSGFLKRLAVALEENKLFARISGAVSPAAEAQTSGAGLPVIPADEILTLDDAIRANGLPKSLVFYETGRNIFRFGIQKNRKAGVPIEEAEAIERAVDAALALDKSGILFGHASDGRYLEGIKALEGQGFEGLCVVYTGAGEGGRDRMLIQKRLRELGIAGLQDSKRLWIVPYKEPYELLKKQMIADFNAEAQAALVTRKDILLSQPDQPADQMRAALDEGLTGEPGLPVIPQDEVFLPKDAIQANGLPKSLVFYGRADYVYGYEIRLNRAEGVSVEVTENWDDVIEKLLALGKKGILLSHESEGALELVKALEERHFEGLYFVYTGDEGGANKVKARDLGIDGLFESKRLFRFSYSGLSDLLRGKVISSFNDQTKVAQTAKKEGKEHDPNQARRQKLTMNLNEIISRESIHPYDGESLGAYHAVLYDLLEPSLFGLLRNEQTDRIEAVFGVFVREKFPEEWEEEEPLKTVPPLDEELREFLRGVIFELSYPVYPVPADSKAVEILRFLASYSPAGPRSKKPGRAAAAEAKSSILVAAVDDTTAQREAYRTMLEPMGRVQFLPFETPDEAAAYLRKNVPDLLITDVMFGSYMSIGVNGLLDQVARAARRQGKRFTVVISTGLFEAHPQIDELKDWAARNDDVVDQLIHTETVFWQKPVETAVRDLLGPPETPGPRAEIRTVRTADPAGPRYGDDRQGRPGTVLDQPDQERSELRDLALLETLAEDLRPGKLRFLTEEQLSPAVEVGRVQGMDRFHLLWERALARARVRYAAREYSNSSFSRVLVDAESARILVPLVSEANQPEKVLTVAVALPDEAADPDIERSGADFGEVFAAANLVKTVAVSGKVPDDLARRLRTSGKILRPLRGLDRKMTAVEETVIPTAILDESLQGIDPMFLGFQIDWAGIRNPLAKDYTRRLAGASLVHAALMLAANPDLRNDPATLRAELLRRLAVFEGFASVITLGERQGQSVFVVSGLMAEKFLEHRAALTVRQSA